MKSSHVDGTLSASLLEPGCWAFPASRLKLTSALLGSSDCQQ
jgi:hypothetical protein